MCPACMTTAALIAGGFTSAGGLGALVVKKFHTRRAARKNPVPAPDASVSYRPSHDIVGEEFSVEM